MNTGENFIADIDGGGSDIDNIMATLINEEQEYFLNNADVCYDELESKDICHSTQIEQSVSSETVSPTGNVPSMKAFNGHHDFTMNLNSTARSSWVYSESLNQVFIDMKKVLMVQFHVKTILPGMFIRALPVYSSMDYVSLPVVRCTVHSLEDDPSSIAHSRNGECRCADYKLAGHVVRMQSSQGIYCYDSQSQRHSVKLSVIQPQPGSNCIEVPYFFTCKTSCYRGMHRRAINVVFTLETHNGHVMGRQVLPVKICSCPKRDKQRMERTQEEEKPITPRKRLILDQSVEPDPEMILPDNDEEDLSIQAKRLLNRVSQVMRDAMSQLDDLKALF